MHPLKTLAIAAALAAAPASVSFAQSSPLAVGVNLGTPGLGAEAQVRLTDTLVARGDFDWLGFSHDETISDIRYSGRIKSTTGGLFADWHPFTGAFLVSGGAYLGPRRLDLSATPSSNVVIGGQTFTPSQVGRIDGKADYSKVQPFLGLGWDNTFSSGRSWGFRGLLGVSYSQEPDVTLTSTGGALSADPTLQARLLQEEATVRHDARYFRYYPVVQVGVTHRF